MRRLAGVGQTIAGTGGILCDVAFFYAEYWSSISWARFDVPDLVLSVAIQVGYLFLHGVLLFSGLALMYDHSRRLQRIGVTIGIIPFISPGLVLGIPCALLAWMCIREGRATDHGTTCESEKSSCAT